MSLDLAAACSVEICRLFYIDRGVVAVDPIDVGIRPERIGVVVPVYPHAGREDATLEGPGNRRFGDLCGMSAVEQRSSEIDQFGPVRKRETASARLNFTTRNIRALQMVPARCVTGVLFRRGVHLVEPVIRRFRPHRTAISNWRRSPYEVTDRRRLLNHAHVHVDGLSAEPGRQEFPDNRSEVIDHGKATHVAICGFRRLAADNGRQPVGGAA